MKLLTIMLLLLSCAHTTVQAQTAWQLKKDEEGIKVYTASVPNSNLKSVKVTCSLNASLPQLYALLQDNKAHEQWVYNTKRSYLVKQLSKNHWFYYSEVSLPWPLANRDIVVEIKITQHPTTNVMYVSANAVNQYVPMNKGMERVVLSKVNWVITPITNNQMSVEYIAQADPGGDVPAWIVNSFSTKGPFETFKKLKEIVASPAYMADQANLVKK